MGLSEPASKVMWDDYSPFSCDLDSLLWSWYHLIWIIMYLPQHSSCSKEKCTINGGCLITMWEMAMGHHGVCSFSSGLAMSWTKVWKMGGLLGTCPLRGVSLHKKGVSIRLWPCWWKLHRKMIGLVIWNCRSLGVQLVESSKDILLHEFVVFSMSQSV